MERIHYVTQTFKIGLLGALILSFIFSVSHLHLSRYFPIQTVRVYGINHLDQREVQSMIAPLVDHGFFATNVEYIRDRMLQMPWVSDIFVRRNWPDQVNITVVEQNPIAQWNNQGLLSGNGVIFTPSRETYPRQLPHFVGPDGKHILMLEYANQMNRLLMPLHAKISYLEMTPYLTWKLILDNGVTIQIGHKDILTRLEHFVRVYSKVVGSRAAEVDSIDLRYSNGVAVRWKTPVKT